MTKGVFTYNPERGFFTQTDNDNYRGRIADARNVIVKVGSDVLVDNQGELDPEVMLHIAEDIAEKTIEGYRITLVSSGAAVAGRAYVKHIAVNMTKRALCIGGQSQLMYAWNRAFSNFPRVRIGQILLQDYDFSKERRTETKEGFDQWYSECYRRGIAIVNANDATWPGETEQDNDALARKLYSLLDADFGLFLSNIDGLLKKFDHSGDLVDWIQEIDADIYKFAKGGMRPKMRSIDDILKEGGQAVVANGKRKHVIKDVLEGANIGTYFSKQ